MLEVVEVGEVRDAVAEIRADCLVDAAGAGIALEPKVLYELEPVWQPHVRWRLDAGRRHQPTHALL